MPLKKIDVENCSTNAIDCSGFGLKPGQRVECEVSSSHYDEITTRDGLKIHSVSEPYDVSDVAGPEDPEAVAEFRAELADLADAVREDNKAVYAYDSARVKATQLGINLNDVLDRREEVEGGGRLAGEDGRVTLAEVILYSASRDDRPYEGPIEGGARTSQRRGYALVDGKPANYPPGLDVVGHPYPANGGHGKPANEGHSTIPIEVTSEGLEPIERKGFQKATGTQDEFKPLADEGAAEGEVYLPDERDLQRREDQVGGHEDERAGLPPEEDEEVVDEDPSATPAAREKAAELGVDIRTVVGTGRDGDVLVRDVEEAAEAQGKGRA